VLLRGGDGWVLAMLLVGSVAFAETAYVTEQLVVGVYPTSDLDGERIGTVRSADSVEVLDVDGEATQIRLQDGTEGWVKSSYLEAEPPPSTRIAALEAENKKLKGAAASGVDAGALQKSNTELRAALEAAQRDVDEARRSASSPPPRSPADEVPVETAKPHRDDTLRNVLVGVLLAACSVGGGFAWGYYTLERRVRRKYGGLKVY